MLLGQIKGLKKYYGNRLVLEIDQLDIYAGDKIGIVGRNGCGKTTLLQILTNQIESDEGKSQLYVPYAYITQLEEVDTKEIEEYKMKQVGVENLSGEGLSGGEMTRLKLAKELGKENKLLIADEPTSHLDYEGIKALETRLKRYDGAVLLVSHDREFLDSICNKVLEIEKGKVTLYPGNYSKYKVLKEKEFERSQLEYEEYVSEKQRLEKAMQGTKEKSKSVKKTPSRMGNSEARLHKMGNQGAKLNLDKAAKRLKSRIEQLEVKQQPQKDRQLIFDAPCTKKIYSKIAIQGIDLDKSYENKVLFNQSSFKINTGTKTAIVGPNGSGKTTLLNMIIEGNEQIRVSQAAQIGYFRQDIGNLDPSKTLLENIMVSSIYNETFVRTLLARTLFAREDVDKKVEVLSGGERVKGALIKILVSDINLLILDEPTNYLDIYSLEAIEEAIKAYQGTVVFVSHDRRFIKNVASHILEIKDHQIVPLERGIETKTAKAKDNQEVSPSKEETHQRMILENRLAEIIGRLSSPQKKDNVEALDLEYQQIVSHLKR